MPLNITSSANGIPASDLPSGAVIQSNRQQNQTQATKVFSSWNVFEEVPGTLRATITPTAVGNQVLIAAHIAWGGWSNSIDVAANFRIRKLVASGNPQASFQNAGGYTTNAGLGIQSTIGVATGCYKWNQGNTNSSWDSDDILISDTVSIVSPTIYGVFWACGYAPNSRTLYWNRSIESSQGISYNPVHVCTITVTEIKA